MAGKKVFSQKAVNIIKNNWQCRDKIIAMFIETHTGEKYSIYQIGPKRRALGLKKS